MPEGLNQVVLVGVISHDGVEMRYNQSGVPCASFILVVQEHDLDGKASTTRIPCQVEGPQAEATGECETGQVVRFEGKLKKRQSGELVVSGFEVTPVAPSSALVGSN